MTTPQEKARSENYRTRAGEASPRWLLKPLAIAAAVVVVGLAGCATSGVNFQDQTSGGVAYPNGRVRKILSVVPPEYPAELRKAGIAGTVVVQIAVARDGTVASVKVVSSPHAELSDLALAAARKMRFEPLPDDPHEFVVLQMPVAFELAKSR